MGKMLGGWDSLGGELQSPCGLAIKSAGSMGTWLDLTC